MSRIYFSYFVTTKSVLISDGVYLSNNKPNYVYVSTAIASIDEPDCLIQPEKMACSSLNFALTNILMKEMTWINIVYLDSYSPTGRETIYLSVLESAVHRNVVLTCSQQCFLEVDLDIFAESFQRTLVIQVQNISFQNSRIAVGNVNMMFNNVSFLNSLIADTEQANDEASQVTLQMSQTKFEIENMGNYDDFGIVLKKHLSVAIFFTNLFFVTVRTEIQGPYLFYEARNTAFQSTQTSFQIDMLFLGVMRNVSFTEASPSEEDTALLNIQSNKLVLTLEKCVVQNSAGGLKIIKQESGLLDSWMQINIQNSIFQNNTKLGSGAGIEVHFLDSDVRVTEIANFVKIENTTFTENKVNRLGRASSEGGAVSLYGETSGKSCDGIHIEINSSNFTNNQAADGGGALYMSDKCLVTTIFNSSFVVTHEQFDSPKGVFIWSSSDTSILLSVFKRDLQVVSPTLLELEMVSEGASILELNMTLQCHEWYKIKVDDKFVEEQAKELKVTCQACSTSFYMPSDGQFFVSYHSNQASFVMQGTGSNSDEPSCTACPAGAECPGNDLNGKPNFWGSNSDHTITMYECPSDYCCTENCTGYDQCSGHRTGVLCGSCEENFSLSMLSSDCIEAKTCDSHWLWPLIILAMIGYMAWYTFKGDVLKIPAIILRKILKRGSKVSDEENVDKGYFGIVTYFIQVKAIMVIPLSLDHTRIIDQIFNQIENYIQLVLNFELSSTSNDVCAMKDLTTTKKMIFRLFFLFGIFVSWSIAFISLNVIKQLLQRVHLNVQKLEQLKLKLVNGLVEIIKYTYLGFTSIVFYSLTCTSIAEYHVWYYDGSIQCYSRLQIAMAVFGLLYLSPFPFLIYMAMKLLSEKKITRKSFFLANCFPLPVLLYWVVLAKKQNRVHHQETDNENGVPDNVEADVEKAVYDGFKGGFRESEGGAQYWESVLMLRRLAMSATILFTNAMIQLTLCLTLCLVFLIHHLKRKPFVHSVSNEAETLSLSMLCGIAAINLLKASVLYSNIKDAGPQEEILLNMELMEIVFVVILIGFIVFVEAGHITAKTAKKVAARDAWQRALPLTRLARGVAQVIQVNAGPTVPSTVDLKDASNKAKMASVIQAWGRGLPANAGAGSAEQAPAGAVTDEADVDSVKDDVGPRAEEEVHEGEKKIGENSQGRRK